jgi:choline-sulfatase
MSDALVSAYDFLPTVLDYLGLPPAEGRNLPGRSAVDVLRGDPPGDWPDAIFGEYGRARMIRTGSHKYVHRADGGPNELYDLQRDPGETVSAIDVDDEAERVIELRTRIFRWFEQYGEAGADPIGQEYLPR